MKTALGKLGKEMLRALSYRGATKKNTESIKMRAPDTGGRPFHFAHHTVSKDGGRKAKQTTPTETGVASARGGSAAPEAPGAASKVSKKGSGSAAHHGYIERPGAIERSPVRMAPEQEAAGQERTEGREREPQDGPGREAPGSSADGPERSAGRPAAAFGAFLSSAGASQGYIENPVKLANGESAVFSFGTIAERFEDRVGFWEALEASTAKDARF